MSINNYYNDKISYLDKMKIKERKDPVIVNFLVHYMNYWLVYYIIKIGF